MLANTSHNSAGFPGQAAADEEVDVELDGEFDGEFDGEVTVGPG
jgi:hypothetical protein